MALLGVMAYSFVSAVVLVLPIEPYLVGLALFRPEHVWFAALLAAAAHMAGKLLHFFLGTGLLHRLNLAHRAELNAVWAQRWEALAAYSADHPWAMSLITVASASVSLPPFAAMPFLAASVGMRWWTFALAGLLGRWVRFWAVMAVPGLLPESLVGL